MIKKRLPKNLLAKRQGRKKYGAYYWLYCGGQTPPITEKKPYSPIREWKDMTAAERKEIQNRLRK